MEFYLKRHDLKAQIYKRCKLDNTNKKNVSFIWTKKSAVLLLLFFIILKGRTFSTFFLCCCSVRVILNASRSVENVIISSIAAGLETSFEVNSNSAAPRTARPCPCQPRRSAEGEREIATNALEQQAIDNPGFLIKVIYIYRHISNGCLYEAALWPWFHINSSLRILHPVSKRIFKKLHKIHLKANILIVLFMPEKQICSQLTTIWQFPAHSHLFFPSCDVAHGNVVLVSPAKLIFIS